MKRRTVILACGMLTGWALAGDSFAVVRIIDRDTNWPYIRVHCYVGIPAQGAAAHTGMGMGVTELWADAGDCVFAIQDSYAIQPWITYHIPEGIGHRNRSPVDQTINWIYTPDNLVWGPACKRFCQTFKARAVEISAVRCQVASADKEFRLTVHANSPDGPQVGPPRTFEAGQSRWGLTEWKPGEVPTEPGKTYAICIEATDGSAWNPFFHSTGNRYADGMAYFDGVPEPSSDLGLLIRTPENGFLQALPGHETDEQGWVQARLGHSFVPRTANILMAIIDVDISGPKRGHTDATIWIRENGPDGKVVGPPEKTPLFLAPKRYQTTVAALWNPRQVRVTPGKTYYVGFDAPGLTKDERVHRVRARLYGEEVPNGHASIAAIHTHRVTRDRIEIGWYSGNESRVSIEYGLTGQTKGKRVEVAAGASRAVLQDLKPDTEYAFRLRAVAPGGQVPYYSPWFLTRTRAANGALKAVGTLQQFEAFEQYFLPLANAPLAPDVYPVKEPPGKLVEITNPSFEQGSEGWQIEEGVQVSSQIESIQSYDGQKMCGWYRQKVGEAGSDAFRRESVVQSVAVEPDKTYLLTTWVRTDEPPWTKEQYRAGMWSYPHFSAKGWNRVCLVCDPTGGKSFEGSNSTQWFTTHAKWVKVYKQFRARAATVTIGARFFQRSQREWDAAHCDAFELRRLD